MLRPMPFQPFRHVRRTDEFEVLQHTLVGRGTYGEVRLCRDRRDGARVAMKKILVLDKEGGGGGQGFPVTALREIKLLRAVRHDNVVRLRDMAIEEAAVAGPARRDGYVYMVFEFIDFDLSGLLKSGITFDLPQVKCLAQQLLEGVNYLHEADIIHRDLKAANILVARSGCLKIADFGLARYFERTPGAHYTPTVCTRWYRPPELLLGEPRYTPAIDVWSAACIVGELLLGTPILQGATVGNDMAATDLAQLLLIYKLCGSPTSTSWPGSAQLQQEKRFQFVHPREVYPRRLQEKLEGRRDLAPAVAFLDLLLIADPARRPTARDALLRLDFFFTAPFACARSALPLPDRPVHDLTAGRQPRLAAARSTVSQPYARPPPGGPS